MQNNKLLIISYYWPPSGGSGVQRWLNFSNHLIKKDWDITVFTAKNPKYPILDEKLNETVDGKIKVVKIPIFEPAGFLKKNNDNIKSSSIFKKTVNWIRANLFFPDSRMFWINTVTNQAIKFIKKNEINCLITTAPPFSTNLIGLKIKKKTGIKWISDYRDPWAEFFQFKLLPMSSYMRKKHVKYELKCLQYSDTVLTTSPSLTEKYSKINLNTYTLYNGFDSFLDAQNSTKFLLMYCGTMKSIQNPKNLWFVLNEICEENENFSKDLSLRCIGNFDNEVINDINFQLTNLKVQFQNYLNKEELDKEITKAKVLLMSSVNLDSVNNIIPGKLFYYFSAQRPILAFSNLNSDVSKIIELTNTGSVFDYSNKIDLKNHILELYNDFKSNKNNFKPKGITNYTFEVLSKNLDQILHKTIS
jgi:glycosyltransferase involved in cell wall biosynthesis